MKKRAKRIVSGQSSGRGYAPGIAAQRIARARKAAIALEKVYQQIGLPKMQVEKPKQTYSMPKKAPDKIPASSRLAHKRMHEKLEQAKTPAEKDRQGEAGKKNFKGGKK